ncbi:MAG: acyl-CoA thioesterase domain-containing protein [Acidimicrobiales bacterium]|jgi:acyl-CoA thioesterase-2
MAELSELLGVLDLEPVGEGRYRAQNFAAGLGGVVFGGQLLAQTIVAAATVDPSKEVKSVHTVFARGGALDQPLDIEVEAMHVGRALGSATVTIRQGDRLCTRSLVLLSAVEPDLIRHGAEAPEVGVPEDAPSSSHEEFWEVRVVDGVDISDPEPVGPAELFVWSRFPGSDAVGVTGQALLAYATDGFLIGTAMRPHAGFGQALSHVEFSTSVLTHTLTFHEPIVAGEWYLLAHESPYAGRGRSYGRANVFTPDGRLVASFVQENMVRAFPEGQKPVAGERSKT